MHCELRRLSYAAVYTVQVHCFFAPRVSKDYIFLRVKDFYD
jgi:hypothetical protein